VFAQVPPRVDYALTELGVSLGAPIAVLTDWAESHVGQIMAARDEFETTPA
jgi:DNA-binding HxlR family transcriptional regulator